MKLSYNYVMQHIHNIPVICTTAEWAFCACMHGIDIKCIPGKNMRAWAIGWTVKAKDERKARSGFMEICELKSYSTKPISMFISCKNAFSSMLTRNTPTQTKYHHSPVHVLRVI